MPESFALSHRFTQQVLKLSGDWNTVVIHGIEVNTLGTHALLADLHNDCVKVVDLQKVNVRKTVPKESTTVYFLYSISYSINIIPYKRTSLFIF